MDFDDYREHVRSRVLLLACLAVAVTAARWLGLFDPSGASGVQGRAAVVQFVVLVIVVGWIVVAVIGLIGLVQWLRTDER